MKKVKKPQKQKKANTDHIAHQVGVTGVGAHKNKKKYSRAKSKRELREATKEWR